MLNIANGKSFNVNIKQKAFQELDRLMDGLGIIYMQGTP
jgi:hypothetical protein